MKYYNVKFFSYMSADDVCKMLGDSAESIKFSSRFGGYAVSANVTADGFSEFIHNSQSLRSIEISFDSIQQVAEFFWEIIRREGLTSDDKVLAFEGPLNWRNPESSQLYGISGSNFRFGKVPVPSFESEVDDDSVVATVDMKTGLSYEAVKVRMICDNISDYNDSIAECTHELSIKFDLDLGIMPEIIDVAYDLYRYINEVLYDGEDYTVTTY